MKLNGANLHGPARRPLRSFAAVFALAACLAALAPSASAQGQAFKFQGGTSTLFGGHGGSVEVRGSNYTGRIGLGLLNGKLRYGMYYATTWHNILWGSGDQSIPFALPTDIFNRSYYFLGRGVSASWKDSRNSFFVYGGTTTLGFSTPFLSLAEDRGKAGALFYERKLTSSLRFYSHNVVAARQTSLQGIEWAPSERMRMAFTGGIGNNQRYWASSLSLDKEWIEVDASYSRAGDAFRRIRVEAPISSETDRENIRITLKPLSNLQFTASRQNYLSPLQSGGASERATVNGFSAWTSFRGLQVHGSYFDSTTQSGRARGLTVGGRRNWFNRVETSADYMRSAPSLGPAFHSMVGTVRERITPRISLSQVVTLSNGQANVSFGGSFFSNRFSFGLEYQTIFLPFQTGGSSQFKQVLALNLRLRLWGGLEVNGASDVTPLGKVRYTAYATGYSYRGAAYDRGNTSSNGAIYDYVVRGRVVEEGGQPVRGAALKIDEDIVFTDSQGSFSLRRKKPNESEISVAFDQFVLSGNYAVISAPKVVKASREETAELYEVVLKRLRNVAPVWSAETNITRDSHIGTVVRNGTVLELPTLPLTRRSSMSSDFSTLAARMPVLSRDANRAMGKVDSASDNPVGSYFLYPAAGGAPVDLRPVKVVYAKPGGQRSSRRTNSGKR
ncbi:MAG: hypothetical protein M1453_09335 [Acidobacteria bacterium]|nr:hypothetical protein [Acidobacteriota bacterium]MCL5288179.1 hypothetical protein [Acidobacteriota bacterium]